MITLKFIFISLFVFLTFQVKAQEDTILIAADTTKTILNPNAPAKAAYYSALVPGLGQAYNKKYWKIPLVYVGLGFSIYSYVNQNKKYQGFRTEYKKRLNGTSLGKDDEKYGRYSDDQIIRGQQFHQRNRDLSMLISVGIYILNIVDANVDAHLMQFNVNDNLSIKPDFKQNELDYKYNYGLTFTYKF